MLTFYLSAIKSLLVMYATTLVLVLSNDDLQDYSTDIARFAGE